MTPARRSRGDHHATADGIVARGGLVKRGFSLAVLALFISGFDPAVLAAHPAPSEGPVELQAPAAEKSSRPTPRLAPVYDIAVASRTELRGINVGNASILEIGIGDSLDHLKRSFKRPRSIRVEDEGTENYHRVFRYDDVLVRVDADERISRIKVMASGAWIMRNILRRLMKDFSESLMRQIFGWNYYRKLKRVYVWRISRKEFMQDKRRERLLDRVRAYYGFETREEAEKKIIKAWDTVYIYPDRGIRVRVFSNIPISGHFRADFVLIKPVPLEESPGGKAGGQAALGS